MKKRYIFYKHYHIYQIIRLEYPPVIISNDAGIIMRGHSPNSKYKALGVRSVLVIMLNGQCRNWNWQPEFKSWTRLYFTSHCLTHCVCVCVCGDEGLHVFPKGLARKIVTLPPRYIQRKIKEKNEDAVRFSRRFNGNQNKGYPLCCKSHRQKGRK